MLAKNVTLLWGFDPGMRLRSISYEDIENLRVWKNKNKETCFLQEDISPEQQEEWYRSFCRKEDDFMFVVDQRLGEEWKAIGCMGFRELRKEDCVDAYNIIRGNKYPSSFTLGDAFCVMLAYAASLYTSLPVRSKVLKTNPAVEWYKKNHFFIATAADSYFLMEIDKNALTKYNWKIKTIQK